MGTSTSTEIRPRDHSSLLRVQPHAYRFFPLPTAMALTTSAFPGAMVDPFSGAVLRPTTAPPGRRARPAPAEAATLAVDGRSSCGRVRRAQTFCPPTRRSGASANRSACCRASRPSCSRRSCPRCARTSWRRLLRSSWRSTFQVRSYRIPRSSLVVVRRMLLVRCRRVDGGTHVA